MLKNRKQLKIQCSRCSARDFCLSKDQAPDVVTELNNLIHKVSWLSKGEHLFHLNDKLENIYAVFTGSCKEYTVDENGNERINNFFFPGDIIGLESIPDRKHLFSTCALEDASICIIPLDPLLRLMSKHNDLLKRFIDIGSYKMQNDNQIRPTTNANQRIADFICNMYTRLQERNKNHIEIELPMTQLDISNFLGMSHETVNRILRSMHNNNIIQIKNKSISKIDIDKLKSLFNATTAA